MSNKLLLSVSETAALMGLSRPTVYQLTRRADFPVVRLGGRVLILAESLETWLAQQAGQHEEGGDNDA